MEEREPTKPGDPGTRREFLADVTMLVTVLGAFVVAAAHGVRFLLPKLKKPRQVSLMVGKVADVPPGESLEIENLLGNRVIIVHTSSGFNAFSAVCTHLGCFVRWEKEQGHFLCPCHQGLFDINGQVIGGPPPRPLESYAVKAENERLFVTVNLPETA
jgi:cytochrome b6-f complex iron-sulfur subunit